MEGYKNGKCENEMRILTHGGRRDLVEIAGSTFRFEVGIAVRSRLRATRRGRVQSQTLALTQTPI